VFFITDVFFTDSSSVISASMQRRRYRGKNVTIFVSTNDLLQLTESGAGEIFQAVLFNQVVSSGLYSDSQKSRIQSYSGHQPRRHGLWSSPFSLHGITCALC